MNIFARELVLILGQHRQIALVAITLDCPKEPPRHSRGLRPRMSLERALRDHV